MLLQEQKRRVFLWLIKSIIEEIFRVSLISYLLFYLIDDFRKGFISDYFNLNILLGFTIISGIITVAWQKEEKERKIPKIQKKDYIFIVILGLISAGLIYYRIKEIGKLAYLISAISGIIIILISILLLKEPMEEETINHQGDDRRS